MDNRDRKKRIKEIEMVVRYSQKVYGSCTASYMGCMADANLLRIVGGGDYGALNRKPYSVLFSEATDKQIKMAHEYVTHWIPMARSYLSTRSRIARATRQFAR